LKEFEEGEEKRRRRDQWRGEEKGFIGGWEEKKREREREIRESRKEESKGWRI